MEQEHKRRPRYKGTHPRTFQEKYKEHDPEKYRSDVEKIIERGKTPAGMHIPIMVSEILDVLQIQPGQTGYDATLGYGGHTRKLLEQLQGQGHLYATDVDPIEMEKTRSRLAAAGYRQYEISNFARAGFQSRHNLKYWMGRPYIGFGPGAHSDFGGRRYSFTRDLEGYIAAVLEGGTVIDESDLIPQRERGGEYLMLRLRTTRGIEEWEYRREFFMNFDPIEQKLEEYERQGWAERHDRRWNLTAKGFLVSNQLIGELLSIQEEATLEKTLPRLKQGRPEEG